mgnify:FL=1
MAITLDVTGFYFSEVVPFNHQKTVQEVMEQVALKTKGRGTVFDFDPRIGSSGRKLNSISVEFKCDPPRSRQVDPNTGIGREKNDRLFFFCDKDLQPTGATDKNQAQFVLAWQYYVTDKNGTLKNGTPQSGGFRTIVPFSTPVSDFELCDGDTITWRLVAIFSTDAGSSQPKGKYPDT